MTTTESVITAISQVTDLAKPIVKQACDFAEALLGEPFRVSGTALADQVYAWQTRNRIRILEKARKLIEQHNIDPQYVATGFLMHALEASRNVEDEELQDLWARLLAGALEDESAQAVLHIETLRKLSPDDAAALAAMTERFRQMWWSQPIEIRQDDKLDVIWLRHCWSTDQPPREEFTELWSKVISRLEAVNIIERNSVQAVREVARTLHEYFKKSRLRQMNYSIGKVNPDSPFDRADLFRLTNRLKNSVNSADTWVITPYGLDLFRALGMTNVGEPLVDAEVSLH